MKRSKKRMPFGKRSKTKRREEGIWVSNHIEQDRYRFGGRFCSFYYLMESANSDPEICPDCNTDSKLCTIDLRYCGQSQSLEFKFLGKHKYDVWDAEIATARCAFWNQIDETAFDRAWNMLSPEERDKEAENGFNVVFRGGDPLTYPQFGGLSFYDYHDKKLPQEILEKEPPEIYECFEVDYTLSWGYGLKIILDVDVITLPLIIQSIDRFFAMGQKPWRSEKPIPRDRLPLQTESDYVKDLRARWNSRQIQQD